MNDKLSLLLNCPFDSLRPDVQKEMYIEYYHDVYGMIFFMTNDHAAAEDCIQDSFLKVIKHVPYIENAQALKGWIRVVAKNTAYSYLRKNKKYRNDLDYESVYMDRAEALITDSDCIAKEVELKIMAEEISKYLRELKPDYQQVVELRWKHGLSYKEIAYQMNTTDQIVKHKLHRAREAVKKRFVKEWGDYDEARRI